MKMARGGSHVWLSLLLCTTTSSGTHPACALLICPLQGLLELSLPGLISGALKSRCMLLLVLGCGQPSPSSVKVGVCWVGKILPYRILRVSRQLLERYETAGRREGGSNSTPALGGHSG